MLEKTARSMQMMGSTSSGRPSKKAQQVELKDAIKRLDVIKMAWKIYLGLKHCPAKGLEVIRAVQGLPGEAWLMSRQKSLS